MDNDGEYRDAILDFCKYLIDGCNEVWIYVYDMKLSEGQQVELNYAIDERKDIRFIKID